MATGLPLVRRMLGRLYKKNNPRKYQTFITFFANTPYFCSLIARGCSLKRKEILTQMN
jgi:hypothetical protein